MTDKIFLRELKVDAVIGIWEWERRIEQTVSIDLEMATDARAAAADDSIDAALNYKEIAKHVTRFTSESRFQLVESLAEAVAKLIVTEHGVAWVRVAVSKPGAIEGSRDVGVVVERTTEDYA